jgi:hypothetical protein
MSKRQNEYESAEMVLIGAAQDIVLGIKDVPSLDSIPGWPLIYRTDDWSPYDW